MLVLALIVLEMCHIRGFLHPLIATVPFTCGCMPLLMSCGPAHMPSQGNRAFERGNEGPRVTTLENHLSTSRRLRASICTHFRNATDGRSLSAGLTMFSGTPMIFSEGELKSGHAHLFNPEDNLIHVEVFIVSAHDGDENLLLKK